MASMSERIVTNYLEPYSDCLASMSESFDIRINICNRSDDREPSFRYVRWSNLSLTALPGGSESDKKRLGNCTRRSSLVLYEASESTIQLCFQLPSDYVQKLSARCSKPTDIALLFVNAI